jgi:hypothetical protein
LVLEQKLLNSSVRRLIRKFFANHPLTDSDLVACVNSLPPANNRPLVYYASASSNIPSHIKLAMSNSLVGGGAVAASPQKQRAETEWKKLKHISKQSSGTNSNSPL